MFGSNVYDEEEALQPFFEQNVGCSGPLLYKSDMSCSVTTYNHLNLLFWKGSLTSSCGLAELMRVRCTVTRVALTQTIAEGFQPYRELSRALVTKAISQKMQKLSRARTDRTLIN